MCCGSRRAALRTGYAPAARTSSAATAAPRPGPSAAASAPPTQGGFPTVLLDYFEAAPIRVRGPVTGRPYAFRPSGPAQPVDARDAAVLTRSRAFRQAPA